MRGDGHGQPTRADSGEPGQACGSCLASRKVERHSALFPKRTVKAGEARALAKRALTATAAQAQPGKQPAAQPIKAARVTGERGLAKLRAVHQSSAGQRRADRAEARP